jgi:NIPSNAP
VRAGFRSRRLNLRAWEKPMIYELRTYTVRQGTLADVVKAASTVSRDIRKDDYGKLEGYWFTDIGPLNQVMHLWSYADLNERARLRAELAKNPRWSSEYIPFIRPHLIRQDIRLMHGIIGLAAPAGTPNVYELRTYRTKAGAVRQWADHMVKALPVREKYSKIVCLWMTEAPQPNEVCHIWAYSDLNQRAQVRAEAPKDPGWASFLKETAPLLEEMHSAIIMPAPHSPLK